jgi:hypothetical protein
MTRIHDYGNSRKATGGYAVMMNQVIVRVQYVRPVNAQLLCNLPDRTEVWPGWFSEGSYDDTHSGRLCFQPPGVNEAIDNRLMAFRELAMCQINGEPFQTAHIEIVDKLYDSHGFH